jgi:hypothetical protein
VNILTAIRDRNLLGSALVGDNASWDAWRSFLAAFFGLPLDGAQASSCIVLALAAYSLHKAPFGEAT